VIAARAFDVLTAHSPAVGQYSVWSSVLTRTIFSPGPLLYWLIAIPAHFMGSSSMPICMGLLNVLCMFGIVILARRRGGTPLMLATAIALVLMCRSLPSESLHDIWNPYAPVLPLVLLLFVAWSLACGEHRLLPLAALITSFAVQTHLGFALPAIGALVVGVVGLITTTIEDRRALRRWTLAAVGVTAACWIAPLAEQVFRPPGNLYLIVKAALERKGSLGASPGWHAVAGAVGIPPWWLRAPIASLRRFFGVISGPGAGAEVTCGVILAVLLGVLVIAVRHRRRDVIAPVAIALVLCASIGASVASTPTQGELALTIGYTIWWTSAAGMFVWLALGYALVRLLTGRPWRVPAAASRLALPAGVVVAGAAAILVAAGQPPDGDRGEYRPFRAVADRLTATLPHPGTVLVTATRSIAGFELQSAVVYALRRQGATVLLPAYATGSLGHWYVAGRRRYEQRVMIGYNEEVPGRVIARVTVRPPAPVTGQFVVSLAPARG
jgi:hypothetical protein